MSIEYYVYHSMIITRDVVMNSYTNASYFQHTSITLCILIFHTYVSAMDSHIHCLKKKKDTQLYTASEEEEGHAAVNSACRQEMPYALPQVEALNFMRAASPLQAPDGFHQPITIECATQAPV